MTSADAIQIHRRCDGAFELLVNANLLFFQRAAGISVRSNLPFRRPGQNRQALNNVLFLMHGTSLRLHEVRSGPGTRLFRTGTHPAICE